MTPTSSTPMTTRRRTGILLALVTACVSGVLGVRQLLRRQGLRQPDRLHHRQEPRRRRWSCWSVVGAGRSYGARLTRPSGGRPVVGPGRGRGDRRQRAVRAVLRGPGALDLAAGGVPAQDAGAVGGAARGRGARRAAAVGALGGDRAARRRRCRARRRRVGRLRHAGADDPGRDLAVGGRGRRRQAAARQPVVVDGRRRADDPRLGRAAGVGRRAGQPVAADLDDRRPARLGAADRRAAGDVRRDLVRRAPARAGRRRHRGAGARGSADGRAGRRGRRGPAAGRAGSWCSWPAARWPRGWAGAAAPRWCRPVPERRPAGAAGRAALRAVRLPAQRARLLRARRVAPAARAGRGRRRRRRPAAARPRASRARGPTCS